MSYRLRDNRYPDKGRERPIEKPSELHLRIFKWLDPFYYCKFLDSRWITFLEPGEGESARSRSIYIAQEMGRLFEAPNLFVDRHIDQNNSLSGTVKFRRPAVYNLDDKGKKFLPYPYREALHRSKDYAHEFMVDMGFYAPGYAALRADPALSLVDTYDLLTTSEHVPESTKKAEKPFNMRLHGDLVKLDGRPQVWKRTRGKREEAVCIPGIQHENVTKGVDVADAERSSVGKHLRQAIELHENGKFEEHYGFDRVIQPFTFSCKFGEQRARAQMLNAMSYVKDTIGRSPQYLWFKVLPFMPLMDDYAKPSSDFFLSPWLTVSGEEVTFNDELFFD